MSELLGSNQSDLHLQNQALVLRMLATERPISRADISRRTGLTKTTASKIVSDLMDRDIICETKAETSGGAPGRKPIHLGISPKSPCVCGLLIKRNLCSAILADLAGTILVREDYAYTHRVDAEGLVDILFRLYDNVRRQSTRRVFAIGIAAIGPLDPADRRLGHPPNFHGISGVPLVDLFTDKTGLPAYIISDASAGALAEKIYGGARRQENFIYLHIMNGIGAGYVLHHQIYRGDTGQSGEIGHTSINFAGPVCNCGNPGCLEMYANLDAINRKLKHLQGVVNLHSVLDPDLPRYTWRQIIDAAAEADACALSALDEFCAYVSHALTNAVNLLDISHIVVGYDAAPPEDTLAAILAKNLAPRVTMGRSRRVTVVKSVFGSDAPLIGSVALVTSRLFDGEMRL